MSPHHSFKQQKSSFGLRRREKGKKQKRREEGNEKRGTSKEGQSRGCDTYMHTSCAQSMHVIAITKKRSDRQKVTRRCELPVPRAGDAASRTRPQLALPRGILSVLRESVLKALFTEKRPLFVPI